MRGAAAPRALLLSDSGAAYHVGTTWVPSPAVGTALGTKRAKRRVSKPCWATQIGLVCVRRGVFHALPWRRSRVRIPSSASGKGPANRGVFCCPTIRHPALQPPWVAPMGSKRGPHRERAPPLILIASEAQRRRGWALLRRSPGPASELRARASRARLRVSSGHEHARGSETTESRRRLDGGVRVAAGPARRARVRHVGRRPSARPVPARREKQIRRHLGSS